MSNNSKAITSLIQLKNEFFYVFGIVPLEAYNVIGDGITDNSSAIQKSINDAINNDIKYIFVSKGNYFYLGNLENADKITFVGNSIDTYMRNIPIRQFPEIWKESLGIGASIVPIGGIIQSAIIEIPEGYLLCDGRTLEIEKYKALYEAIIPENQRVEETTTFTLPTLDNEHVKHLIRYK